MGVSDEVGYDTFPTQGSFKDKRVRVCFNYEISRMILGKVIREDIEKPGLTIIQLDDGRVVLSTECQ
jgi:hypothetical protein